MQWVDSPFVRPCDAVEEEEEETQIVGTRVVSCIVDGH